MTSKENLKKPVSFIEFKLTKMLLILQSGTSSPWNDTHLCNLLSVWSNVHLDYFFHKQNKELFRDTNPLASPVTPSFELLRLFAQSLLWCIQLLVSVFFFSLTFPSGASRRVRRGQRGLGDRGDNLVRSGRGSHRLRGFKQYKYVLGKFLRSEVCISSKSFRGKFVFLPLLLSSLGISWPLTTSYIFRCLVVFLSASIITLPFSDSHFSASLLLGPL